MSSSTRWRAAASPLLGIGVGTPGIVDQTARSAGPSPRLAGPPARPDPDDRHGLPTVVANDRRAAALATYLFSGDERPANLVVIKVGRGIGAGMVLRDQVFGGDGEAAGEIGHVVVDPDGTIAIAVASAVSRRWRVPQRSCAPRAPTTSEELADGPPPATTAPRRGPHRRPGARGGDRRPRRRPRRPPDHARRQRDRARRAVARRGPRRGHRRSLAAPARDTIDDGGTGEDVTLLGACALLLTRELGLTVHR